MADTDPLAWLAAHDEPQRSELSALHAAIVRVAPQLRAYPAGGMLAYGRYRYRYASGRQGDWSVLAIAPRKAGISLYVGPTPVEPWAGRLPNADCGKGCIRVKRAADLEPDVLAEIVTAAAAADGRLLDWTGKSPADAPTLR